MTTKKCDFLVIGSGYGGSILSAILAKAGRSVLMIDRDDHPRFAVGESSTPISDATLAQLGDIHDIPELRAMASYGTWQENMPEVRCGLKRGFSYFCHDEGVTFHDTPDHTDSSMVAASASDYYSDTQWLRSDTDAYFVKLAQKHGAEYRPNTTVGELCYSGRWRVELINGGELEEVEAAWIIDATGHGGFSRARLGAGSLDHELRTKARTIYGHFKDFGSMDEPPRASSPYVLDPNFRADDSTQHHIVRDGWIWAIRFNQELTSVGLVTTDFVTPLQQKWEEIIATYPTFAELMSRAKLVESLTPQLKPADSLYRCEGQISKLNVKAHGPGWVALPNAFGFIDPLQSTGIAHNLTGIRRLASIFALPEHQVNVALAEYEKKLDLEVRWIDLLVGLCFAGLPNRRLFMDCTCAYFVAAIAQEQANNLKHVSDDFLSVSNTPMRDAFIQLFQLISSMDNEEKLLNYPAVRERIRMTIKPWNHVGLLSDETKNRINRSAVAKWLL